MITEFGACIMYQNSTLIYHITHIENLSSILSTNALYSTNKMNAQNQEFIDIAYTNIQDRRSQKQVPIPPYGNLHDYVPFYFAPRSPMLYTISRGNIPGYKGTQEEIIYLFSTVETVISSGLPFTFTDGHAVMNYSGYYNNYNDLNQIDWNVMQSQMWNDTIEYPDRKRKRQAEFLVFDNFPIQNLIGISTFSLDYKRHVESCLMQNTIPVYINREWYY